MNEKPTTYLNPELFPPKSPPTEPPTRQQLSLHEIQQQIGSMRKLPHLSGQVKQLALTLAYESIRMVWLAIDGRPDQCRKQVELLDAAQQAIAETLLAPVEEMDVEHFVGR